ncbi:MAG TPA: single-stranded DNA-binding protein [Mucilaginibacter sp.]
MPFNATVNRVFLLGKIADDPVWTQKGNKRLLCFTLSTTEEIRKGDTLLEHVENHRLIIPSDIVGDILVQKGKWAYIQGKIQTRVVFEDGVKLYRTEIWATNIELIKMSSPMTHLLYNKF